MKTIYWIIIGFLIAVAASGWLYGVINHSQATKAQIEKKKSDSLYLAVINTKPVVVKVYDTVWKLIQGPGYNINPSPRPTPTPISKDSVGSNLPCPQNYYAENVETDDFTIRYEAIGNIESIKFPAYKLKGPREIITTRYVARDTCSGKVVQAPERSHISIYASSAFWTNINTLGLGADWTYRNKWAIAGGPILFLGNITPNGKTQFGVEARLRLILK